MCVGQNGEKFGREDYPEARAAPNALGLNRRVLDEWQPSRLITGIPPSS